MPERLAWPLRVAADGRLAVVVQDSPEDVEQCIAAILRTRPGDRDDLPDMGIEAPEFEEHIDAQAIENMIAAHEPRATVTTGIDLQQTIADVTVGWSQTDQGANR